MDVALQWLIMQTEEKYVQYENKDNAPSATQILVSSHKVEEAQKLLRREYATTKTVGY